MLDGHHRAEALRQLGRAEARCLIWDVDDQQALTLLATLNRLEGQDDPHQRAALIEALHQRQDLQDLAKDLPEPAEQLQRMLQVRTAAPSPKPPPREPMPEAMHFFFKPETRRAVEARLRQFDDDRQQALLKALHLEEA
jgi:ParB-like chromosome segregation protein Spo0J